MSDQITSILDDIGIAVSIVATIYEICSWYKSDSHIRSVTQLLFTIFCWLYGFCGGSISTNKTTAGQQTIIKHDVNRTLNRKKSLTRRFQSLPSLQAVSIEMQSHHQTSLTNAQSAWRTVVMLFLQQKDAPNDTRSLRSSTHLTRMSEACFRHASIMMIRMLLWSHWKLNLKLCSAKMKQSSSTGFPRIDISRS